MKFYILVLLFSVAYANMFAVKEKDSNATCALLNLTGSLELQAWNKTKEVGELTVNFDGAKLNTADSNCTSIILTFDKEVTASFEFSTLKGEWLVTTLAMFNPVNVFPNTSIPDNATLTFSATPVDTFNKNGSYVCLAERKEPLDPLSSTKFTYKVMADVQDFRIQSVSRKDESFAPTAEECVNDTTSTPAASSTTPQTASTATTATTASTTPNPVPEYTCSDTGNVGIRLDGDFALAIDYNTTTNGKATAFIDLSKEPENTAGSTCNVNATTQTLVLNFFKGWKITFLFSRPKSSLLTAAAEEFSVSNITVSYVFDDHFINATEANKTATVVFSEQSNNYLKATTSGYYSCKANTTVNADNVKLSTKNFKYTAFSSNNATFSGNVAECSADEDSSSVVPIAVGAALAGLVVIVLIAYLIGRRRSRKSGYESV